MHNNDNFTIGDTIRASKDNLFFKLNPNNLRVHMSPKNRLFVMYFHDVLEGYCKEKQKSGQVPEIFFNKVISELIRTNKKLDFITRGWYLYGIEIAKPNISQSTAVPTIEELTNIENQTESSTFTKEDILSIEKKIIKIADAFDCNKNYFYWERKQYENYKNVVYLAKLNLQETIMKNRDDIVNINQKLSDLSLNLIITDFSIELGKLVLLEFIDIAKKVIISNNNHIPNLEIFNKSFDDSWKVFGLFNLHLSAEGMDADKIKLNIPKKIEYVFNNAEKSNKELMKQIKTPLNMKIKPNAIEKIILSNINEVSQ